MQTFRKLPISSPARNASVSNMGPSNMRSPDRRAEDSVAHESRLCKFHEVIKCCHVGDGQAFHAVEEAELEKIRLKKSPRRRKDKTRPGGPFAGSEHLLRRQRGVAVHGAQMFRERAAREVQKVGFEMAEPAAHLYGFMHEGALPGGLAPVVEAHLAVGIPAGVANPAAQILRHPRHFVGVALQTGLLES